ncbi:hypothetical protein KIN20_017001 [Parelaphostrongylus tenuis]|uniref:Uncharacterized protein n=1 Tax=Parelaphostrongylus tenuis TaxID=148309 RepID=A0AAD5MZD1_PARTN|nr:hypothetical protein KIN20_017001 [Parelaphostrongylus tenuis]
MVHLQAGKLRFVLKAPLPARLRSAVQHLHWMNYQQEKGVFGRSFPAKINHGKDDDLPKGHIGHYNLLYMASMEMFSTQMFQSN